PTMLIRNRLGAACAALVLLLAGTTAQAHWGIGVSLHVPIYPFGCCYPYHCYRPYPIYVAPAPVIVAPAVVQPVYPAAVQAAPASPVLTPTPTGTTVRAVASDARSRDIEQYLQTLNSGDDKQRIEAMMQLGRLRAEHSVDVMS